MWFRILSQLSSIHIHTLVRCHHTVHSWGKEGLFSFTTILYCHSTLLSSLFQAHTQPLPGDSRGRGLPQELKGLVSGPVWPGSCWESPAPPQLGTGEPHCLPPSSGWGLGCQEGGRGLFCKNIVLCKRKSTVESNLPHFLGKLDSEPWETEPHPCLLRSPIQTPTLRTQGLGFVKTPKVPSPSPTGDGLKGASEHLSNRKVSPKAAPISKLRLKGETVEAPR